MNLSENKVMDMIQGADKSKWMMHCNHNTKCFTKGEIEVITNNYQTMIGSGAYGEVFKGVLEDTSIVAVKKLVRNVKENFAKELTIHREINHKNVVKLIGYCVEDNALMMVTEYIPNGNLSDVLHRSNSCIPLDIRLRIAIECAEALAYMHSYMYTQVIHGDIKPANILLDGRFNAKVSDFGISRLVSTDETLYTENVKGRIGYMDPLFARDGRLTVKSDVYSFGVVLVELIGRRKATTVVGKASIIYILTDALSRGLKGVREMFDAEIASQSSIRILEGVAKLAGECLRLERNTRPEMIDVVVRLRMLRKASTQELQQRVNFFSWTRSKPADWCRQFSYAEMTTATKNFDKSNVIGSGEYGSVFRGWIDGGATTVAIKCLKSHDMPNNTKSNLRHRHIVTLIGYCNQKDNVILVYCYMAHGNLRELQYLHRGLGICIGAARGLQYLHRGAEYTIIHRNVKMTNILLDDKWVAKISVSIDTDPFIDTIWIYQGNWPDPEYRSGSELTEKSGVYYFGAVLLEVLCARPVFQFNCPTEQRYLLSWAVCCKEQGNIDHIVDPNIKETINPRCLDKFVETAVKCIAERGVDRPWMEDVISDLEHALLLQDSVDDVRERHAWSSDAMGKGPVVPMRWHPEASSSSSS